MTYRVLMLVLATALAVATGCSAGDTAPSVETGGTASGGTIDGRPPGAMTAGEATAGQSTSGTSGGGGTPEQTGGHANGGAGATAGAPSPGMGGAVSAGTNGGGASGVGGAGETGGTAAYAPCPTNNSLCKILPLGDSITRGAKSSNDAGYRSQLFKLIVAAKQKVTFTGSLTNGPMQESGEPFPRMHEGHSGWTINQLSPLIPSPALAEKPNIILVHIGTNDIGSRDPTGMATRLDALVDKLAQNAPDALVVVAQITPARTDNDIRNDYNAKIPAIIESHAAKGRHIIGVDMNKLPMAGLNSDGVHPNDEGYAYMAGVWYAAIKDLLPR